MTKQGKDSRNQDDRQPTDHVHGPSCQSARISAGLPEYVYIPHGDHTPRQEALIILRGSGCICAVKLEEVWTVSGEARFNLTHEQHCPLIDLKGTIFVEPVEGLTT